MLSPALMLVRCRRCSKFRHPGEFIGTHAAGYCWHCYEGHQQALKSFAGEPPTGCQACGKTFAELEWMGGSADVRFGFHPRDGIYQVLGMACGCSDEYERKRLDLYGDTPYGHVKKLKGAH